jgi:hypothetical protein
MPMVKFTPSPEQREVVAALSASKMPLERIAASIINPRTKRAISVKTLRRLFKEELRAVVHMLVKAHRGIHAALDREEPWAIKYALDHQGELKAREKEITAPQSVKQDLSISPYANEPEEPPPPDYTRQPGSSPRLLNLSANPPRLPKPEHKNKFEFQCDPPPGPPKQPPEPSPDRISRSAASNSALSQRNGTGWDRSGSE